MAVTTCHALGTTLQVGGEDDVGLLNLVGAYVRRRSRDASIRVRRRITRSAALVLNLARSSRVHEDVVALVDARTLALQCERGCRAAVESQRTQDRALTGDRVAGQARAGNAY